MIPKKIHYTWFSGDPFPPIIENCLKSWHQYLGDYELVLWDMEKISHIDNIFLREAIENKKWAFAADFVRLYALYHEGGIYLDTDVEVYRTFDDLLHNKAFIGKETSYHIEKRRAVRFLTSHCMGAHSRHPYIKQCLDYYKDRHFVLSQQEWLPDDLKFDQTVLPRIQAEIAVSQGYDISHRNKGVSTFGDGVMVYPNQLFDPEYKTRKSYCIHLAMGGWRNRAQSYRNVWKKNMKTNFYLLVQKIIGLVGCVAFRKL